MLADVTRLHIPTSATRDMNDSDMMNLINTYAIAEQARDAFLNNEITLDEYCQLLETAQVNIDSYLENVEQNLIIAGAM